MTRDSGAFIIVCRSGRVGRDDDKLASIVRFNYANLTFHQRRPTVFITFRTRALVLVIGTVDWWLAAHIIAGWAESRAIITQWRVMIREFHCIQGRNQR